MSRFEDDADAQRRETILQELGDLLRQSFLHLRPGGEVLDGPGELGESGDVLVRVSCATAPSAAPAQHWQ